MPLTKKEKLAYIAGLLDADGCISIANLSHKSWNKRTDYYLKVRISNADIKMLKFVKETLNYGGIYIGSNATKKRNRNYDWTVSAVVAEKFLKKMLPYLITKKFRAQTALEFRETKDNFHRTFYRIPKFISDKRAELFNIMKLLNSRLPQWQFLKEI